MKDKKYTRINILGFLPYFGWLIPLKCLLRKDDSFRKESITYTVSYASFFFLFSFVIYVLLIFATKELYIYKMILTVLFYLLQVSYLTICLTGAIKAKKNEVYKIKLFDRLAEKFSL